MPAKRRGDCVSIRGESLSNKPMNHLFEQCLLSQPEMRAYALLDGAMLPFMPAQSRKLWPTEQAVSLLDGATPDEVKQVGPLLFPMSAEVDKQQRIKALADQQSGRTAGSIILTLLDQETLRSELRKYVDVRLEGGLSMVMRFYDSRVLPLWWEALPVDHQNFLSRICKQWLYWDEEMLPAKLALNASATCRAPDFPVALRQEQEDCLLTGMQPHMLIERFRVEDPDLLATIPVFERHDFFQMQIKNAAIHGISIAEDLEVYCYLALRHGPLFDKQAKFEAILSLKATGVTWTEALTSSGT